MFGVEGPVQLLHGASALGKGGAAALFDMGLPIQLLGRRSTIGGGLAKLRNVGAFGGGGGG